MKITKHIIIRILAVAVPLLLLYFYSEMAFEANRQREHRTDVGLGIAFLVVFVLIILLVGFITDSIIRIYKKQYSIAMINVPFLLLFLIPVLYISCQFSSEAFYCQCFS
ncbi:hypothetical protein [Chryseobacterium balustinum]|uniref:Uncharacterized protein n=1 Tax=Chryseobacterium balustinum TaxID=246 RepID=A0AAX2INM2_9FLAO|nr:hypothetical protein [Chryseobacterium balustinum]AZB29118.1 hypothetical protein EB354_07540 [Chryseobacterium balustinum]SKC07792.1 hypothetical protein SAMN05421800_12749 [Chryseobacterium balustinum]SQA91624.1 Uncharacterised protein [Chryseobacterium balustinum]